MNFCENKAADYREDNEHGLVSSRHLLSRPQVTSLSSHPYSWSLFEMKEKTLRKF